MLLTFQICVWPQQERDWLVVWEVPIPAQQCPTAWPTQIARPGPQETCCHDAASCESIWPRHYPKSAAPSATLLLRLAGRECNWDPRSAANRSSADPPEGRCGQHRQRVLLHEILAEALA